MADLDDHDAPIGFENLVDDPVLALPDPVGCGAAGELLRPGGPRLGGKRSVSVLLALASNAGAPARARIDAAFTLGGVGGSQAIEGLRESLGREKGDLHFAIASALTRLNDETGIEALAGYLGDRDRATREAAVDALGETKSESSLTHLIDVLDDRDELVARKAWMYLKNRTGTDLEMDQGAWREWLHRAQP